VVFHQGDPCDALFLLREGRVAVRAVSPEGQELTMGLLAAPDVFGEVGLIRPDHRHSATVVALGPVVVASVPGSQFTSLRVRHPELTEWLLLTVTARLDRTAVLLAEAHHLDADRRVARRLLDCRRSLGIVDDEPLPLTQEDVAAMAGVTRPTANRALRQLEETGIVRLGRRHIEVLDEAGLARAGQVAPG
jgi:CRP-like cAMP-binding protein